MKSSLGWGSGGGAFLSRNAPPPAAFSPSSPPPRRVIFTADDFGLSEAVNEAIERAHIQGVLTSTSLMVAEPAVADAVRRARTLPGLRVGLHLTLVDGRPLLPPERIPLLVGPDGRFRTDMAGAGVAWFFRPGARRQLAAEVRAQFEAFAATGLELDHLDCHHHLQMHPTLLGLALDIGRKFGLRAVRLPAEPWLPGWRASGRGLGGRMLTAALLRPWSSLVARRIRNAGLVCNDQLFGMTDFGRMDEAFILRLLDRLPQGVTELVFHPSVTADGAAGEGHMRELRALTSHRVAARLRRGDVLATHFGTLTKRPWERGSWRIGSLRP